MNIIRNQRSIVAGVTAIAAFAIFAIPAQAQQAQQARSTYDWLNNQPQIGQVHRQEMNLEKQLRRDYNRGFIDSLEYAQLQRDLDGIGVCEDEFRMDHNGLGQKDVQGLKEMLNRFQANLNRETADKGMAAQVVLITQ